ncbi:MAG: type II toxin-antitoxin system HicA family toxin [Kiritimatiellia bacterium]
MKEVSGKKLAKAVAKNGRQFAGIKGSHHIFVRNGRSERIVIPIHGSRPLKAGLLRSLMKIAELTEGDI